TRGAVGLYTVVTGTRRRVLHNNDVGKGHTVVAVDTTTVAAGGIARNYARADTGSPGNEDPATVPQSAVTYNRAGSERQHGPGLIVLDVERTAILPRCVVGQSASLNGQVGSSLCVHTASAQARRVPRNRRVGYLHNRLRASPYATSQRGSTVMSDHAADDVVARPRSLERDPAAIFCGPIRGDHAPLQTECRSEDRDATAERSVTVRYRQIEDLVRRDGGGPNFPECYDWSAITAVENGRVLTAADQRESLT